MSGEDITIHDLWIQQQNYNQDIGSLQPRTSAEWMQNYILGVVSELGELLEEVKWKHHRVSRASEFSHNTVEQLADITKYVISMWQVVGITPDQMIGYTYEKGKILEQLLKQETQPELSGRNIIMLDLDGCLADFRSGFLQWLELSPWKHRLKPTDIAERIHMDIDHGWDYGDYHAAKLQFEKDGGYYHLPAMSLMIESIKYMREQGWYIIVYTARPYTVYKRIWGDTWRWLENHTCSVDELHFGHEARVVRAIDLAKSNKVISIEDDPTLIVRYISSGIPVYVEHQPYNRIISDHPLLFRSYGSLPVHVTVKYLNILAKRIEEPNYV